MKSFTRRAFVIMGIATACAGFHQSPAHAQRITIGATIGALVKVSQWAWPHLQNALIDELSSRAMRYVVEHRQEFVKVIVHATQEVIQMIEDTLRKANDHLMETSVAAIAAGIVITAAITEPAAVAAVPAEIVTEAVGLPFLLFFYHEDLLNFVAGRAYEVSIVGG